MKTFTNAIYEFGHYYQRNAIGFAIVHFGSPIISCSSYLVLKLGLQNDEKPDLARTWHVNNVSCAVFKMVLNYSTKVMSPDILPKFLEALWLSGKMTPKKGFLALNIHLAQKTNKKSQKKTRVESTFFDWRCPWSITTFVAPSAFTRPNMLLDIIKRSFSYQNGIKLTAASLLNLDTLDTGSRG